jgi:putative transposase
MTLFRNKYRVESARLSNWDYSTPGYYFVTICAYNRSCIFGDIINDIMRLNEYGKIVSYCINQIPGHCDNAEIDEQIVMPNHVHAIIRLLDSIHSRRDVACRGVACNASTCNVSTGITQNSVAKAEPIRNTSTGDDNQNKMSAISPKPDSLSTIVRSFKSAVTNRMHVARFMGDVWQPRFHDHIIRNDRELFAIRRYIKNNPANWKNDRNVIESTMPKTGKQPWFVFMG